MPKPQSPLHRINALDLALCLRCNRVSRYRAGRSFFRAVSRLGDGAFWYVLMALLPLMYGDRAWPVVLQMLCSPVSPALCFTNG